MESFQEKFLTKAPYGLFICDGKGKYLQVNEAACRITGYAEEELLNRSFSDLLFEENLQQATEQFALLAQQGQVHLEIPFRHKTHNKRWWSVAAEKISEDLFLAFCFDITDSILLSQKLEDSKKKLRETNEEYLALNEELLQTNEELRVSLLTVEHEKSEKQLILNTINDMVIYLDLDMNVVWANRSAAQALGKTPEEIIGKSCHSSFSTNPNDSCKGCPVKLILAQKEPVSLRKTREDGRIWDIKAFPVFDNQSTLVGVVETMTDITQIIAAELALKESNKRYEAILTAIPDLVFIISKDGYFVDYHASKPQNLIMPPAMFLNKKMEKVLPGHLWKLSQQALEEVFSTGLSSSYTYSITLKGKICWFEAVMIKTSDSLAINIIKEITRQKENEMALQEKIGELEKFNNIMVGRENKMIELKKEVNELLVRLKLPPKYKAPDKI